MEKINLHIAPTTARNKGDNAENALRFTLTGEVKSHDSTPFTAGGDVLDIQVKSANATVCKGTDIDAHIARDGANRYAFVTKDLTTAYILTPSEWSAFVKEFSYTDHDSAKNGGAVKLRLKRCENAMREWLERA